MSLFRPRFRPKSSPNSSTAIAGAYSGTILDLPYHATVEKRIRRNTLSLNHGDSKRIGCDRSAASFEDTFIRSLVSASTCRRCVHTSSTPAGMNAKWARQQKLTRRIVHTAVPRRQQAALAPEREDISREEYKELVNTYDLPSDLWEEPIRPLSTQQNPSVSPREHHPLAPRLVIPAKQEHRTRPKYRQILRPDSPLDVARLKHLKQLLKNSGLGTKTNEIWAAYSALPSPRPGYLEDTYLHALFQQLVWVEFKHHHTRFFEYLEECVDAGIELTSQEWNSAIAFAGRWARNVSDEDVKRAVETWMRMEHADAKPTVATFNILFDVASRARRFALADTVMNELEARGIALNRYVRTSLIYNAGLRRNAEDVRKAFRDFVNAGEIVDTVVMNCVILSLIRSGEIASAESVYEKMKALHALKRVKNPDLKDELRTWQEDKRLGTHLNEKAQKLREEKASHEASFFGSRYSNEDHKEEAQRRAPIAPNTRTMRILVQHHCYVTSSLDRVQELIAEMRECSGGRDVNGYVFVWLFEGFGRWGGKAYTEWNPRALEDIWEEFVDTAGLDDGSWMRSTSPRDELSPDASPDPAYTPSRTAGVAHGPQPNIPQHDKLPQPEPEPNNASEIDEDIPYADQLVHYSTTLSRKAIYAFYKCCGRKRALAAWDTIQRRWIGMTERDRDMIEEYITRLMGDGYGL